MLPLSSLSRGRPSERDEDDERGGTWGLYSCIGEVTVHGNCVRAGASGTRRRSVTRPTDPLTRLTLSLSRPLLAAPFSVTAAAAVAADIDTAATSPLVYSGTSTGRIASRSVSPRDSRASGVMARRYANAITRLRERDRGPERRYGINDTRRRIEARGVCCKVH